MIAYIKGTIVAIGMDYVLIDNQGIGYRVYFNKTHQVKINDVMTIYTYHHVREDEISLFGFISLKDVEFFNKLISVKGIGPKTGMNILSKCDVEQLIMMIEDKNLNSLKSLPGVGAKTASQIILDLSGKLVQENKDENNNALMDALEGLKHLGYKSTEIQAIIPQLKQSSAVSSDEYLKLALQYLVRKK